MHFSRFINILSASILHALKKSEFAFKCSYKMNKIMRSLILTSRRCFLKLGIKSGVNKEEFDNYIYMTCYISIT